MVKWIIIQKVWLFHLLFFLWQILTFKIFSVLENNFHRTGWGFSLAELEKYISNDCLSGLINLRLWKTSQPILRGENTEILIITEENLLHHHGANLADFQQKDLQSYPISLVAKAKTNIIELPILIEMKTQIPPSMQRLWQLQSDPSFKLQLVDTNTGKVALIFRT